jgi:hypothetical protein
MNVFVVYKDNDPNRPIALTFDKILEGFYQTSQSKLDAPFERLLLNYFSKIGSFGKISDDDWENISKSKEKLKSV